jgi:hypothetical protein
MATKIETLPGPKCAFILSGEQGGKVLKLFAYSAGGEYPSHPIIIIIFIESEPKVPNVCGGKCQNDGPSTSLLKQNTHKSVGWQQKREVKGLLSLSLLLNDVWI